MIFCTLTVIINLTMTKQKERLLSQLTELKRSLAAYGRVIDALGIAMLLDSLFSAALLIAGRNRLFTQSD